MGIFFNPERKVPDLKISGFVWTGPCMQLKHSGDLNGIRIHDLCDAGTVVYLLNYEATQLRAAGQFGWNPISVAPFPWGYGSIAHASKLNGLL